MFKKVAAMTYLLPLLVLNCFSQPVLAQHQFVKPINDAAVYLNKAYNLKTDYLSGDETKKRNAISAGEKLYVDEFRPALLKMMIETTNGLANYPKSVDGLDRWERDNGYTVRYFRLALNRMARVVQGDLAIDAEQIL